MGRHGNQNPPRQIRIIENRLIGHHPATGQVWAQVVGHPELVDVLEWKRDPETGDQSIAPVRVSAPKPKPRRQPGHRPAQAWGGPPVLRRSADCQSDRFPHCRSGRLVEWKTGRLTEWAIGGVCYVFCRFHLECFHRYQNVQKRRNGFDPPHGSGIICGHSVAVRQTNC